MFVHLPLPILKHQHLFSILLALMLSLGISSTRADTVEFIDYQKVLNEERAWAGLSTKTIRVGDVVWSYSEGGPADRPALLLIHGIGMNRDSWNHVARNLTQQYRVIIVDLPGSGQTLTPKGFDLSLPHLTEQLRRFAEALRIENQLNLAGHSVGGSIGLMYAAKYPQEMKSLFLISAGGLFRSNKTFFLNNPIYLKQLLISQPGDLNYVSRRVMHKAPFVPSLIKKQQEQALIQRAADTSELIHQLVKLNQQYTVESFAQLLKNIEVETLILWGKQDQIVNVEVAHELGTALKKAHPPILLDQIGHTPIVETPDLVAQHYLSFLNKMNTVKMSSSN
ncbi:alpha/beta fold hydrolase [Acinetobacter sp. Ver3]|uniref:alpha/beta fold hydrolase n=1 Tax=Acinetobacter sp. Ver3 TaxID=466088 RepID=UPI00044CBB4F|nr:alpha/beta hydrolase [Acinetobacter sp. Ver3]EZQ10411.1 lipase [Acinetobacter sp. Ver3]